MKQKDQYSNRIMVDPAQVSISTFTTSLRRTSMTSCCPSRSRKTFSSSTTWTNSRFLIQKSRPTTSNHHWQVSPFPQSIITAARMTKQTLWRNMTNSWIISSLIWASKMLLTRTLHNAYRFKK